MSTANFWLARLRDIASPACPSPPKRGSVRSLRWTKSRDAGTAGTFVLLTEGDQDAMLAQMADGSFESDAMEGMPSRTFWTSHVMHDVVGAYYAHPKAWSEIGWGGPASPRGYVRLALDRRDAWEPEEVAPGREERVARENERVR